MSDSTYRNQPGCETLAVETTTTDDGEVLSTRKLRTDDGLIQIRAHTMQVHENESDRLLILRVKVDGVMHHVVFDTSFHGSLRDVSHSIGRTERESWRTTMGNLRAGYLLDWRDTEYGTQFSDAAFIDNPAAYRKAITEALTK